MNSWLGSTLQHLHMSQALIAGGVGSLVYGLQIQAAGTLASGAERWQTAIRQLQQAPVNVADVLRARGMSRR